MRAVLTKRLKVRVMQGQVIKLVRIRQRSSFPITIVRLSRGFGNAGFVGQKVTVTIGWIEVSYGFFSKVKDEN